MSGLARAEITVASLEETEAVAAKLSEALQPGDCILLNGPIGAGKTAFSRALISTQLESVEEIPSPTFTLVQVYQGTRFEIWHCDLYRLSSPMELMELGLEEALESSVTIIEWPDRLGELTPNKALHLTLAPVGTEEGRHIVCEGPQRLVLSLETSAEHV